MNILLVEDDALDARAVQRAFARAAPDTTIDWVTSVPAARAHLTDAIPDLVLLDLNLPREPGTSLLRWLRDEPAAIPTPVVVLSTSDEASDRALSWRLGARGYFVKPPEFAVFLERIRVIHAYWSASEPPA
jgi:DNA-binding response OmpR family regulator